MTKRQIIEEPCEGKLSRTVLKTSGTGDSLAEFNKFLATSDGTLVKPPLFFKIRHRELKLLQRRLSRKQKRSKNYEKARIKVARLHHQIDNTRKDFHFKQAHALCDAGEMVFMEDLDYRVSAKGMFGKHMLDAAFGQFRTIVKYVCWKRGKFFGVVDARGTSQECPECGGEVKKDLSLRVHHCLRCGYTTDRDVAASQNIRNRGIASMPRLPSTSLRASRSALNLSFDRLSCREVEASISTPGLGGKETACAVDLPGVEVTQPRQVARARKASAVSLSRTGKTRKSKK